MAEWEIGSIVFQYRSATPPPIWDIVEFTQTAGLKQDFRGWFTVINGDGPINLGDLQIERNIGGAGWENWPGTLAKNVEPGHGIFAAEQIIFPDLIIPYSAIDKVTTLRLRVDWDNGPYYSSETGPNYAPIIMNVIEAQGAEPPSQNEFFDDFHVALIDEIGYVRGLFNAPYQESLGIEGNRPSFLAETSIVGAVTHGTTLKIDATGATVYRVREVRKSEATGSSLLVLEEE